MSIYIHSYIDEPATILNTEDGKRVERLLYTTVHSLMLGQQDQKYVEICVLKHYCNSNEVVRFSYTVTTES
jgi:hypothetical protein